MQLAGADRAAVLAIMLASTVTFVRILIEIGIVARDSVADLAPPIAIMLGAMAAIAVATWLLAKRPAGPLPPVVALHGRDDPRVPVDRSKSAVEALRAAGYRAELRAFPGVRHSVPYAMRRELYGLLGAACTQATK